MQHYERNAANLFGYDLDPLVDYFSRKPVDRDMHPETLFAFDNKAILEARRIRRIAPALGDHINQQIPSPRLVRFPKRTRD